MFSNERERAREAVLTVSFRGSKSRNKVSVGEPAEGSLLIGFSALLCAPFSARSSVSRPSGGSPGSLPPGGERVAIEAGLPVLPRPVYLFQNTLYFFLVKT